MAHIVCVTTGLTGMLHASLELVRRLNLAGHRVTYASPAAVGDCVRAGEFPYHQLPPLALDPCPQIDRVPGPFSRLRHKWQELRTLRQRRQEGLAALRTPEFVEFLRSLEPDLVLLDMELHGYIIAAVSAGFRVALLNQFFAAWRRPGLPPLSSRAIPGSGLRGSGLGLTLSWWRRRLQRWGQIQWTNLRYLGTDRRAVLLELARESGFPRRNLNTVDWDSVFTYRGLPILTLTAWELGFEHTRLEDNRYVGPMVYRGPRLGHGSTTAPEAVRTELERAKARGHRIVHASTSTMNPGEDSREFQYLSRLTRAVGSRADRSLFLRVRDNAMARALEALADNVRCFTWLPQLSVLENADLSVVHGGIHTIHECIHQGVPMIVHSSERFDQNGNAARIAHHGLGLRGNRYRDDERAIGEQLDAALADQAMRNRVSSMASVFARYGEDRVLESAVEDLLANKP